MAQAGWPAWRSTFHGQIRQHGSSPRLQMLNPALMSAHLDRLFSAAWHGGDLWARLVESAAGARVLNPSLRRSLGVSHRRERNLELDVVLHHGRTIAALEVKSGRRRESLARMEAVARQFKPESMLLVGDEGIPLEESVLQPGEAWLKKLAHR